MLDEQHAQQDDDEHEETIRRLAARLDECEAERARVAAATDRKVSGLAAENRMLRARLMDVMQLLAAHQEAAQQSAQANRAEGWRAGYDQREAEEQAQIPRQPQGRWLRAVPAFAAPAALAASRVLRSKALLAPVAVTAMVMAVVPAWRTAEFRGGEPRPAVVRAFSPAGGGGALPPAGSPAADTSSAGASPAGSPSAAGTDVPSPAPTGTPTVADSGSPAGSGTDTPGPPPAGTDTPSPPPADSPADTPSPSPADTSTDTGTPMPPPTDTSTPSPTGSGTDTAMPSPTDTAPPACVPATPSPSGTGP